MRTFYLVMLAAVILLIFGLIGFGIYLNGKSNAYITTRLAARSVSVHGARAVRREIRPRLTLASIGLESEHMSDIVSEIDGIIVRLPVQVGERVHQGQEICELENRLIPLMMAAEQAKIDGLESQLLFAVGNQERHESLREKKVITELKYEEIEAETVAIRSQLRAARMTLAQLEEDLINQFLVAHHDGNIVAIYAKIGSRVSKGTPVMLLADFSRLRFQELMPAHDVSLFLAAGGDMEIELPLVDDTRAFQTELHPQTPGQEQVFPIRIGKISPDLTEPALFRHAAWEVENRANLLEPGLYVDAIIRKTQPVSCLVIPVAALDDDDADGRNEVHVVFENDTITRRQITTGLTDGNYVQILDGVREGEIVVTSYAGDVNEGDPVRVYLEHDEP